MEEAERAHILAALKETKWVVGGRQWRGGTSGDKPLNRAFPDEETWDRQALED